MENGARIKCADDECVEYLVTHSYIKNHSLTAILKDFNSKIPLDHFVCYCVGIVNGEKTVHCLKIKAKTPSEKLTIMHIEWYVPGNRTNESVDFWVSSGVSLKKHFFMHEDQLNFFRSTFIYYPEIEQYFRLSSLQNFLHLPECNPMDFKIYNTPTRFHIYRRRLEIHSDRHVKKRKKEFVKQLTKFRNKYNVDGFLEECYPILCREIDRC